MLSPYSLAAGHADGTGEGGSASGNDRDGTESMSMAVWGPYDDASECAERVHEAAEEYDVIARAAEYEYGGSKNCYGYFSGSASVGLLGTLTSDGTIKPHGYDSENFATCVFDDCLFQGGAPMEVDGISAQFVGNVANRGECYQRVKGAMRGLEPRTSGLGPHAPFLAPSRAHPEVRQSPPPPQT